VLGISTAALLGAFGCAHHAAAESSTDEAAIGDVHTIDARSDGQFNVTCNDGRTEVDSAAQIQAGSVCLPVAPPSTGSVVHGADQSFAIGGWSSGTTITTFGRGFWDGYVSFTGSVSYQGDTIVIHDGLGNQMTLSGSAPTSINFARLALPVTISTQNGQNWNESLTLSAITYEVTAFHPIVNQTALSGKADARNATLATYGADIPGVNLSFVATGTFFQNFSNGNACDRVLVIGHDLTVELTPAAPTLNVTNMVAPVSFQTSPTCDSSRLTMGENQTIDFQISVPVITTGNPV
jgi:hypothetical protein